MFSRLRLALLLFPFVLGGASLAAAEKRVALVIGNDSYQEVPKLEKAANDARAVGAQLKKVGFEVMSFTNLNRREMNQAMGQFVEKVSAPSSTPATACSRAARTSFCRSISRSRTSRT